MTIFWLLIFCFLLTLNRLVVRIYRSFSINYSHFHLTYNCNNSDSTVTEVYTDPYLFTKYGFPAAKTSRYVVVLLTFRSIGGTIRPVCYNFTLFYTTVPFRVKDLWIWIVLWIVVNTIHRYNNRTTLWYLLSSKDYILFHFTGQSAKQTLM